MLADAQITQLCDHRGLGRHFLAIVPDGGSRVLAVAGDRDTALQLLESASDLIADVVRAMDSGTRR